jgi:hypothetical protein
MFDVRLTMYRTVPYDTTVQALYTSDGFGGSPLYPSASRLFPVAHAFVLFLVRRVPKTLLVSDRHIYGETHPVISQTPDHEP